MTAADSARFKDFEPQWDKTEVENLPNNEKMLIVPVVRFLNVNYNKEIGFIRRLCISVDANEDFLEANIVELVGNLTFVKAKHNDIFKNYKNASIADFDGVISIYEIDYDVVTQKSYTLGNFTRNVATEYVYVEDLSNALTMDANPINCMATIYIDPDANGNGGGIFFLDMCNGVTTGGSGGGGPRGPRGSSGGISGTSPSSGSGHPYGGGGGVIVPNTPRPHPFVDNLPYDPNDYGVSWGDTEGWGDGVPRDANGNPIVPEGSPAPPIITGTLYQELKDLIPVKLSEIDRELNTTITAERRQSLQAEKNGLNQLAAIMQKIETNTKGVNVEVEVDNSFVDKGGTTYNLTNGFVKVRMCPKPVLVANPTNEQRRDFKTALQKYYALLAHELKHVEQYLDGKLSFSRRTGGAGVLYDANDEVEAYNLQFLLTGDNTPFTILEIQNLRRNGNLIYPNIIVQDRNTTTITSGLIQEFYIRP